MSARAQVLRFTPPANEVESVVPEPTTPNMIPEDPPIEIVRHAASRLVRRLPSVVRYDDLYSAGLTALVEASHRFDV